MPNLDKFLTKFDENVTKEGRGFSGTERRRQPERLQTCYENHNAVQMNCAYLRLKLNFIFCYYNSRLIEQNLGIFYLGMFCLFTAKKN